MNAHSPTAQQTDQDLVERPGKRETPGALHGQVWLTVQTSEVQRLIHGRDATPDKPTIIGLVGFASRLRVIWQAARDDDPYADWWLIKVHEAIDAAGTYIRNQQADLHRRLEQMTAMEVSVAASERPYRVHLQFATPYAYQGAQLLAEYDRLICTALTARHIGLLDSEACVHVRKVCSRKLRALFVIPHRYRLLKIDRASVRLQTGRSHAARQAMGEVPDDILSGEHQAPLVPRKVKLPTGVAGHLNLPPGPPAPDMHLSADKNVDG